MQYEGIAEEEDFGIHLYRVLITGLQRILKTTLGSSWWTCAVQNGVQARYAAKDHKYVSSYYLYLLTANST